MMDPMSDKFDSCPSKTCDGTDIRVHFSDMVEEDRLHWCVGCGIGYNKKRGPFFDATIFQSCIDQMNAKKIIMDKPRI